jgi:hypothetical protein
VRLRDRRYGLAGIVLLLLFAAGSAIGKDELKHL